MWLSGFGFCLPPLCFDIFCNGLFLFFGTNVHTQSQDCVSAISSKLGYPTESMHGNRELRTSTATADEVSPPRPGFWPTDLSTAGTLPPADKSGRTSSYLHQDPSIQNQEQPTKVFGTCLNFQKWGDMDGDSDCDEAHILADFGLCEEENAVVFLEKGTQHGNYHGDFV